MAHSGELKVSLAGGRNKFKGIPPCGSYSERVSVNRENPAILAQRQAEAQKGRNFTANVIKHIVECKKAGKEIVFRDIYNTMKQKDELPGGLTFQMFANRVDRDRRRITFAVSEQLNPRGTQKNDGKEEK